MPNRTSTTGSELFIVDNSDVDWKVVRYLHDWCQIAKALDIATGYFEIGSLLALKDEWQKVDHIRILMGDEYSSRAVAQEHYLMVGDDHIARACRGPTPNAPNSATDQATQNPTQCHPVPSHSVPQPPKSNPSKTDELSAVGASASSNEDDHYPRQDSNL
jgi:hypothetical protein